MIKPGQKCPQKETATRYLDPQKTLWYALEETGAVVWTKGLGCRSVGHFCTRSLTSTRGEHPGDNYTYLTILDH